MPENANCRVLVFGAHPDDAEVCAGGLIVRHCRLGSTVKIVSVTDGRSGHHEIAPDRLVPIRRKEAADAGQRVGAEYVTWDFPDGSLQPDLKVRGAIVREIRNFAPDLVLTHRTNDYHPDHRAVGTAVQDASYMVTVPHVYEDVPALTADPVVAYMTDLFTRPNPLRPDIILDIENEFDLSVQMASSHASQFFEWLAYHDGKLDSVPSSAVERHKWLSSEFAALHAKRQSAFKDTLVARGISLRTDLRLEMYEISEYARGLTDDSRQTLFPGAL